MPEELQHLIERIRKEAIDEGEREASDIVGKAREKAAAIVREAEEKARLIVSKAEADARVFTDRSLRTLSQAARDLLITVGQGVENILADLAEEKADEALGAETLSRMIVKLAEAYAAQGGRNPRLDVLLSPEDREKLVVYFRESYADRIRDGITLRADGSIVKGFKVSYDGEKVRHDFTREAIAEALAHLLRPHLAEIVTRVAREGGHQGGA